MAGKKLGRGVRPSPFSTTSCNPYGQYTCAADTIRQMHVTDTRLKPGTRSFRFPLRGKQNQHFHPNCQPSSPTTPALLPTLLPALGFDALNIPMGFGLEQAIEVLVFMFILIIQLPQPLREECEASVGHQAATAGAPPGHRQPLQVRIRPSPRCQTPAAAIRRSPAPARSTHTRGCKAPILRTAFRPSARRQLARPGPTSHRMQRRQRRRRRRRRTHLCRWAWRSSRARGRSVKGHEYGWRPTTGRGTWQVVRGRMLSVRSRSNA